MLQPLLAAALYAVTTLGPGAADLAAELRQTPTMRSRARRAPGKRAQPKDPLTCLLAVLAMHCQDDSPLPELAAPVVSKRLANGWDPADPLLTVNLDGLAREAGLWKFNSRWLPRLRPEIKAAMASVGTVRPFGRTARIVPAASGELMPWTAPLQRDEASGLVGIVRTAAIIVILAVSGMRSSEVMELQVGARQPPQEAGPGLSRYRIASNVIKGQPLGGTRDEWVVIEPVYQAVGLAGQLHHDPRDGALLFGRFAFDVRYQWFRDWVNGPAGQRLGLAPIPADLVTPRMLRRTLSIELAYRPGGLLAAKLHLKHISVATTEGYASRPGGAQAELLAEVNKHEADRNLELVWAEFRNYQQGIMPAGPGARELTEFFASIDGKLAAGDPEAPKVQRSDREILNLMTRRASTLHLGTANYCWFTDPSRALCLKLAGTPAADRPLAGMCDSARCPQATHHPCHRPVWAEAAGQAKTFLGSLGPARKTEKARLQADYDRARRVLTEIDTASRPERSPAVMRISAGQRQQNEARIRAAIDRLLAGDIPPGGKCDIKTLAREAAVDRAAFYGTRPYARLREEFEARHQARQQAGDITDRREAQIARLKDEVTTLRQRLTDRDTTITMLNGFKDQALARLAAQHDEIARLRTQNKRAATVCLLPAPGTQACS